MPPAVAAYRVLAILVVSWPTIGSAIGYRNVAEPKTVVLVGGGAASTLRGPHGFEESSQVESPSLDVRRISVRVDVLPDVAFVEQTYTVVNNGEAALARFGIRQPNPRFGHGRAVHSDLPLGVAVWLGGLRLPADDISIRTLGSDESAGGYRVSIRTELPVGESQLTIGLVVQTVVTVVREGHSGPPGRGASRMALQVSHYSWGWAPKSEDAPPRIVTQLRPAGGLSLRDLEAESWTAGAVARDDAVWWEGGPWVVVRYDTPPGVPRATTRDELGRLARRLLSGPPGGHIEIPTDAVSIGRLGAPEEVVTTDVMRARRAMIVPATGFFLLLLSAFYWYSHRRKS